MSTAEGTSEVSPAVVETARPPALAISGVERSFGSRPILRGVDLELPAGARGFLGGRNGAGKTTLLRIAAGVLGPHAGKIRLEGLEPLADRRAYQSRLGYLPAGNGGLYARLTVRQNLEFWARLSLLGRAGTRAAVAETLDRFALLPLENSRCDRISMGQRQRVRLATTFIHEPRVVLLDEPHTSLDDVALAGLNTALDEHHERGGASLWCAPAATQAELRTDLAWDITDGLVVPR